MDVMKVDVGCSHPMTSRRSHPLNTGVDDILKTQLDFIDKMIEDGVGPEIRYSSRRFGALECRFAGYLCEDVRKISISPHSTNEILEKSFAINWIAVHGSKAICVVIRCNDVDKACIGPFYKTYPLDVAMYYLTSAIMSEVADLAEPSCHSIDRPYSIVSVNDFQGNGAHEPSCNVEKTVEFLREEMKTSCQEYTFEKTIETTLSAFKQLYPQELTVQDLYVLVCRDIELAPYNLMPRLIERYLKKCSSASLPYAEDIEHNTKYV